MTTKIKLELFSGWNLPTEMEGHSLFLSAFAWQTLPLFMNTIGASHVAKIAVCLLISSMSCFQEVLAAGK